MGLTFFRPHVGNGNVKCDCHKPGRARTWMMQPKVTDRRGFIGRFDDVCRRLDAGDISRRKAAIELGIGFATLKRLLDGQEQELDGVTG